MRIIEWIYCERLEWYQWIIFHEVIILQASILSVTETILQASILSVTETNTISPIRHYFLR